MNLERHTLPPIAVHLFIGMAAQNKCVLPLIRDLRPNRLRSKAGTEADLPGLTAGKTHGNDTVRMRGNHFPRKSYRAAAKVYAGNRDRKSTRLNSSHPSIS